MHLFVRSSIGSAFSAMPSSLDISVADPCLRYQEYHNYEVVDCHHSGTDILKLSINLSEMSRCRRNYQADYPSFDHNSITIAMRHCIHVQSFDRKKQECLCISRWCRIRRWRGRRVACATLAPCSIQPTSTASSPYNAFIGQLCLNYDLGNY